MFLKCMFAVGPVSGVLITAEQPTMQIHVALISGEELDIECRPDDSIDVIKHKILTAANSKPDVQIDLYSSLGHLIEHNDHIRDGDEISVVVSDGFDSSRYEWMVQQFSEVIRTLATKWNKSINESQIRQLMPLIQSLDENHVINEEALFESFHPFLESILPPGDDPGSDFVYDWYITLDVLVLN